MKLTRECIGVIQEVGRVVGVTLGLPTRERRPWLCKSLDYAKCNLDSAFLHPRPTSAVYLCRSVRSECGQE